MRARVSGFRGAEKADIEIDRIALIAGMNGAGKSSVCQGIAAAATSQPIPFFRAARPDKPMFTKTDAKALLRSGMQKGSATIELNGQGVVAEAAWPGLTASGNGKLQCSLVATGLLNPMELEEQDRQRFFSTLLRADPTIEDLAEACKEAIPALADPDYADALNSVTEIAKTNGWDVAHKHFKELGARRKGAWEAKSGESFGSKKVDGWVPQGWRLDLEGRSLEDLGTECTKAQNAVELALSNLATDAANIAQLEQAAGQEKDASAKAKEAEANLIKERADLKLKESARQAIVVPTALACPHCGGMLDVQNGGHAYTLKISEATGAQIEEAKASYAKASQVVTDALAVTDKAREASSAAAAVYAALKGSAERLEAAKKRTGSSEAVDVARDYLASITKDKDLVERRQACEVLAQQIQANQKLVDILAPEGLRRQKLQRALGVFNKVLATLSGEAEYSPVTIDDDLEILYGGRRYFLLSQSEAYRVRAVVMTAVAMYDKSPLVIFDGADVLDSSGRNGLFAMMNSEATGAIHFIIGMTVLARRNVPDLGKAEMGRSYWIEDGIAAPL